MDLDLFIFISKPVKTNTRDTANHLYVSSTHVVVPAPDTAVHLSIQARRYRSVLRLVVKEAVQETGSSI